MSDKIGAFNRRRHCWTLLMEHVVFLLLRRWEFHLVLCWHRKEMKYKELTPFFEG